MSIRKADSTLSNIEKMECLFHFLVSDANPIRKKLFPREFLRFVSVTDSKVPWERGGPVALEAFASRDDEVVSERFRRAFGYDTE